MRGLRESSLEILAPRRRRVGRVSVQARKQMGWQGRTLTSTNSTACIPLRLLGLDEPHRFLNLRDDFRTTLPGDL